MDVNEELSTEESEMVRKYLKYSASFTIKERQTKITLRFILNLPDD